MTEPSVALGTVSAPVAGRVPLIRRLLKNPLAVVAFVLLVIVVLASIIGPFVVPWDPNRADVESVLSLPNATHLLGTDSAGRDVLARLLIAGRVSVVSALIALAVAVVLGLPSGLIAGYFHGVFDVVADWVSNLLMSMPALIVLLAAISVIGPNVYIAMAVFGVLLAPAVFRLTRTGVNSVRNELYVDAARVSGLGNARIIGRHILGVVRAPLLIQAAMIAGIAIVLQSGLGFLGFGDPKVPSWGQMLNDAFSNIYVAPTLLIWPGVSIAITVGALAVIGTALRDAIQGTDSSSKPRRRTVLTTPVSEPASTAESAPADALLIVENLMVGYPGVSSTTVVVKNASFFVRRGEVLGLVGESGSGKTQTAFSILGLLPDGGEVIGGSIHFNGEQLAGAGVAPALSAKRTAALRGKRIAYVPQEPMSNLDPAFTLGFQLAEPMRAVLGLSKKQARERALELLARVGINDPVRTYDSYPHQVSGGMAQRVLIAGAVSCGPELLIADEPTTALDVTVQAEVLDLLRDLQRESNMGVVLVTHNLGVVADLCDRVAVMQSGRIVEQSEVDSLFASPQHPYTRMLLDSTLDDVAARPALGSVARVS